MWQNVLLKIIIYSGTDQSSMTVICQVGLEDLS